MAGGGAAADDHAGTADDHSGAGGGGGGGAVGDGVGGEPADRCKLYFFDDGSKGWSGCKCVDATWHKWNTWDVSKEQWVPLQGKPPRPSGIWAGIGGTRLSKDGEAAIKELFDA